MFSPVKARRRPALHDILVNMSHTESSPDQTPDIKKLQHDFNKMLHRYFDEYRTARSPEALSRESKVTYKRFLDRNERTESEAQFNTGEALFYTTFQQCNHLLDTREFVFANGADTEAMQGADFVLSLPVANTLSKSSEVNDTTFLNIDVTMDISKIQDKVLRSLQMRLKQKNTDITRMLFPVYIPTMVFTPSMYQAFLNAEASSGKYQTMLREYILRQIAYMRVYSWQFIIEQGTVLGRNVHYTKDTTLDYLHSEIIKAREQLSAYDQNTDMPGLLEYELHMHDIDVHRILFNTFRDNIPNIKRLDAYDLEAEKPEE